MLIFDFKSFFFTKIHWFRKIVSQSQIIKLSQTDQFACFFQLFDADFQLFDMFSSIMREGLHLLISSQVLLIDKTKLFWAKFKFTMRGTN